jgi:hypothetical protein
MGLVAGVPLVHCHVTHVSFPAAASPALTRALFAAHTASAWAGAAHRPLARAVAVVSAALASGAPGSSGGEGLARLLAGAAGALGVGLRELAAALDPRLLRLKRLALALGGSLDYSRLHSPASWPPGARGEWAHAVATALSPGALLAALGRLEDALRADDLAAAACYAGGEGGGGARPLPDAWLPPWFLQCVPSAAAAAAVPTLPALALRLHALQRALAPLSLVKAFPA